MSGATTYTDDVLFGPSQNLEQSPLAAYDARSYPPWWQHPAPGQPGGWQRSTWRAGMPPTPDTHDLSHLPYPTTADIEQQRQAINGRLRQYGYAPQQLSDYQVVATMAPLPQPPVRWPDWVEDYFKRNPWDRNPGSARLGVDIPFDQTYEDYNLRNPGLNPSKPTSIGAMYAIPRGALVERYGQGAVDAMDRDWVETGGMTDGAMQMLLSQRAQMANQQPNPLQTYAQPPQQQAPVDQWWRKQPGLV